MSVRNKFVHVHCKNTHYVCVITHRILWKALLPIYFNITFIEYHNYKNVEYFDCIQ